MNTLEVLTLVLVVFADYRPLSIPPLGNGFRPRIYSLIIQK